MHATHRCKLVRSGSFPAEQRARPLDLERGSGVRQESYEQQPPKAKGAPAARGADDLEQCKNNGIQ